MSGWNVGGGEFPDAGDVRVEWRREEFRMRWTSRWNGGGGIPNAICPGGMNVVMSSMKDRYGLYGYGGLGEWF